MKLVWLKYGELLPPDTGGKLRSYHLLRALNGLVDLRLVSYVRPGAAPGYAAALEAEFPGARVVEMEGRAWGTALAIWLSAVRRVPLTVSRFTSGRVRRWLATALAADAPDVVLCDFLAPSASMPPLGRVATVLFEHNVEAALWERKAASARGIKALVYRWEQRALAHFEAVCLRRFTAVLCVSDTDRQQLAAMAPGVSLSVAETGVDVAAFAPPADNVRSANEVVFVGSMDWQPNIQGVLWFVGQIWPQVVAECPDAVFHVVGRRPPASIRRLESPSIRVSGDVASVRPPLNAAAISVVPLLAGGGTRLKIYEAMAAGAPVVSTTVGAEGLDVSDGVDIVLADDPGRFASAIIALLRDGAQRESIADAASRSVAQKDWRAVARRLVTLFEAVSR